MGTARMRRTPRVPSLVPVALLASVGCVVDDPSYLGPARATDGSGVTVGSSTVPTTDSTDDGSTASGGSTTQTGGTDEVCPGWWDPDWSQRRRIDFDNSGQAEDLERFTVLVTLDPTSFDYASAAADGIDLRFVDDDGTTVLGHHVERWEPAGESAVWVRVERIDGGSTDDHIWLYYGNPAAGDGADAPGTYDESTVGVWHLAESSGSHADSATGIECTWLGGGSGSQDVEGRIAGAVELDGNADGIECGEDQISDTLYGTLTAWVRMALTGSNRQCVVSVESLASPFPGLSLYIRRNDGAIGTWSNNGYTFASEDANHVEADQWVFVAIRSFRDDTRGIIEVSRDGGAWETIESGNTNDLRVDPGTPLALGRWPGGGPSAAARGTIDEIRISEVARSDAWVRAQYLSSTGMFATIGEAQSSCPE